MNEIWTVLRLAAAERGHSMSSSRGSIIRNQDNYYWSLSVRGSTIIVKRLDLWLDVIKGSIVKFDCADPNFDFSTLWEYVEQKWGGKGSQQLDENREPPSLFDASGYDAKPKPPPKSLASRVVRRRKR